MQKIIYLARFPARVEDQESRQQCINELSNTLLSEKDARHIRLQVEDSHVANATIWRRESIAPLPEILISIFADRISLHEQLSTLTAAHVEIIASYLVSETVVLDPKFQLGIRGNGTTQICCFQSANGLNHKEFIHRWQKNHTEIALRTQSTFGYRQNLVLQQLSADAFEWSAIVEEHFPIEAMNSPEIFFSAEGDAERLQQHRREMEESCASFINFETINVVHMSEYVIK